MSLATSSGGVVAAVVFPIACSTNSVWTSRFSNCRSNWSMFSLTFSRLLSLSDCSKDLTMTLMFLLTMFILCCVSNRDTTPSRRDASLSMLRFSFFLRIESVAWIFAPSMLPFSIAVFTCVVNAGSGSALLTSKGHPPLPLWRQAGISAQSSPEFGTYLGLERLLLPLALRRRPRQLLRGELQVEDLVQ